MCSTSNSAKMKSQIQLLANLQKEMSLIFRNLFLTFKKKKKDKKTMKYLNAIYLVYPFLSVITNKNR